MGLFSGMETTFLLAILVLVTPTWCKVGFVKDSGMDTIFPPPFGEHTSEYIPRGHLRPLGFQRQPERRITEYKGLPSSFAFYHGYVKEENPIIFHEAVPTEKMDMWTDDYLRKTYGDVKVRVTIKRAISSGQEYKLLKLRKFLKEYKFEDWYLSTILPQEMRKDMPFPRVLQCGTISQYLQESQLWMSSGGTLSLLHYHGDHQFHCLLAGRKDFIFINKKFAADFGMEKPDDFTGSSHSAMNTEMVNMFKYEKAATAPWEWATLRPGDCVFVPAGMLHHVRSYGRSISSVTHWTPTLNADFTDCDKEKGKPQATRTLDDANLIWTFMAGKRQLSNVKLNSESLRHHFFSLLRKDDQLPYVYFETFYLTALKGVKETAPPAAVWKLMDTKKVGHLTRDELTKMSKETLEKVAKILNKAHEMTGKEPAPPSRDEL